MIPSTSSIYDHQSSFLITFSRVWALIPPDAFPDLGVNLLTSPRKYSDNVAGRSFGERAAEFPAPERSRKKWDYKENTNTLIGTPPAHPCSFWRQLLCGCKKRESSGSGIESNMKWSKWEFKVWGDYWLNVKIRKKRFQTYIFLPSKWFVHNREAIIWSEIGHTLK